MYKFAIWHVLDINHKGNIELIGKHMLKGQPTFTQT